jgi:hypothetical protein
LFVLNANLHIGTLREKMNKINWNQLQEPTGASDWFKPKESNY